jgi:hypothetical protein
LPLTSIPPYAPPEQAASDPFWTFAVFAGALAGTAARPILLVGAATTVGVDDRPDIFAQRISGSYRSQNNGCSADTTTSFGVLHWLPVASMPPPSPPEHDWA